MKVVVDQSKTKAQIKLKGKPGQDGRQAPPRQWLLTIPCWRVPKNSSRMRSMKSKEVGRGVPRRKLFHLSSRAQVVTRAPLPLMNSGNAVPMAHGKESLFQGRLKWPLSLGRYGHGKSTGVDGQGTRQFVSHPLGGISWPSSPFTGSTTKCKSRFAHGLAKQGAVAQSLCERVCNHQIAWHPKGGDT